MPADPLTTDELSERLERYVLGPEGQGRRAFLLDEVQVGGRRADKVACYLWASRGQPVEGFEVKMSRADWLNEYENHEKAEPTMAICDRFWLVTNPGIVEPGELPERWGLLLSNGKRRKLKIEKPAPLLRDPDAHHVLPRDALTGLLRSFECMASERVADARQEGIDEGKERAETSAVVDAERLETLEDEIARLREAHETFCEAAELNPYRWQISRPERMKLLGEVVTAIDEGEMALKNLYRQVRGIEQLAGDLTGRMNDAMAVLNAEIHGKGQAT